MVRTDKQLEALFNIHAGRCEIRKGGRLFENCCVRCDDPVEPDGLCTMQELVVEILVNRATNKLVRRI